MVPIAAATQSADTYLGGKVNLTLCVFKKNAHSYAAYIEPLTRGEEIFTADELGGERIAAFFAP
jgi:hypothetical protein